MIRGRSLATLMTASTGEAVLVGHRAGIWAGEQIEH